MRHYHNNMVCRYFLCRVVCGILFLLVLNETSAQTGREYKNIIYATVDGKDLALDIYLPPGNTEPTLIVWVHGGAWRTGSKESVPKVFREKGFAIASVDFRPSTTGKFPAAVHDIKAAIRFLRANASRYGYRSSPIAIAGDSAGGHLAALVGVSGGHQLLEGSVGNHADQSSAVDAIVSYYGASNLKTILSQSTPHGLKVRTPALQYLLGGLPEEVPEVADLASPVTHGDRNDPPLLLIHGDQDHQMPINQSHELHGVYKSAGLDVQFEVVHGAGHGGDRFYTGDCLNVAIAFLQRTVNKHE